MADEQPCNHPLCNEEVRKPGDMTEQEVAFIMDCLVAHGKLVYNGDGFYSPPEDED